MVDTCELLRQNLAAATPVVNRRVFVFVSLNFELVDATRVAEWIKPFAFAEWLEFEEIVAGASSQDRAWFACYSFFP